jgi:hypothetical protein
MQPTSGNAEVNLIPCLGLSTGIATIRAQLAHGGEEKSLAREPILVGQVVNLRRIVNPPAAIPGKTASTVLRLAAMRGALAS